MLSFLTKISFLCCYSPRILSQAVSLSPNCASMMALHVKCRNATYPRNPDIERFAVPDEKVPWSVDWPEYDPPSFSIPSLTSFEWADPDLDSSEFNPKWNDLDEDVNRSSHEGVYEIVDGCPLNPKGRTGLKERGCLGRWGPNHAADPVITRWKRDDSGNVVINDSSEKPILQFVSIQRKDSGEWAIPGGMVDPGEAVTKTLLREFIEEAMDGLSLNNQDRSSLEESLKEFFKEGKEVYRGYVDDPRNTDNSWMETVVYYFHDADGDIIGQHRLEAGDDAAKVRWSDITKELELYASHSKFIHAVVESLGAHW